MVSHTTASQKFDIDEITLKSNPSDTFTKIAKMGAKGEQERASSVSKFKKAYDSNVNVDDNKQKKQCRRNDRIDDNIEPRLSLKYRDHNIKLLNDRLTAVGNKGWVSVFSTHCAHVGKWYFEVTVGEDKQNLKFVGHANDFSTKNPHIKGHIRVGYACRYQRYDVPIGIDKFGFALSDVDGTVVNNRIKHSYMHPYGIGDVVGCYICLEDPTTEFSDPRGNPKLYEFLQNGILCDPRDLPVCESNPNSFVQFSINGEIGEKCKLTVYDGYYHPAVSLYMGATATVNFGPEFVHVPQEGYHPCIQMKKPIVI